jgi:hypothetical protein
VSLDLPGVKVNDLQINVEQNVLYISGFRRIFSGEGDTAKRNRFSYFVGVDEGTDVSRIRANISGGVLVITAPPKPRPEPITVPISTQSHEVFASKNLETKSNELGEKAQAKEIERKVQPSMKQAEHIQSSGREEV